MLFPEVLLIAIILTHTATNLFVLNFSRFDAKQLSVETEDGNAEAGENSDEYEYADPEDWQPSGKGDAGGPGGLGWLPSVKG